MKKIKTIVNVILDESGSMEPIKKSTIDGINEYINSLKTKPGLFYFTLTKFDSEGIRIPYLNKPIIDVALLNDSDYRPNAMTPLYDAIGQTVKKVEQDLESEKGKVAVLVVIMTDGQENASKEYNRQTIKDLITRLEGKGNWTFVFLGANQDSFLTAQGFGISMGNTMDWSSTNRGVAAMASNLVNATAFYSTHLSDDNIKGLRSDSFFTDIQKEDNHA